VQQALDELRAVLTAFLDSDARAFDEWEPLVTRLRAACDAVGAAYRDDDPPPITALEQIAAEFRAEARVRGKNLFADSPLYPWGVVTHVDALGDKLRYRHVSRGHAGPCNCRLVIEHQLLSYIDIHGFSHVGSSDDPYEPYEDYACRSCGTLWREHDNSTEQYSSYSWRPLTRPRGA
jgi:hypothetical protein